MLSEFVFASSLFLGVVLLIGAVRKARQPTSFRTAVLALLPAPGGQALKVTGVVLVGVIALETVVGGWLLIAGIHGDSIATLLGAMVFSAFLGIRVRAARLGVSCGCHSANARPNNANLFQGLWLASTAAILAAISATADLDHPRLAQTTLLLLLLTVGMVGPTAALRIRSTWQFDLPAPSLPGAASARSSRRSSITKTAVVVGAAVLQSTRSGVAPAFALERTSQTPLTIYKRLLTRGEASAVADVSRRTQSKRVFFGHLAAMSIGVPQLAVASGIRTAMTSTQ